MSAPSRVLVRAPNWVGDVVMATPALRAVRRAWPEAEITVEGLPYLRELLEPLASVDRFEPAPGRGVRAIVRRGRELASAGFDLALLFTASIRTALPALARVPRRVGHAWDPLRRALLTDAPRFADGDRGNPVSMIELYLRLSRHVGCADDGRAMDVPVADAARDAVGRRLGGASGPLLLLVPGARYGASKLWPLEHFAAAARGIADEHGLRPVLAPGPDEEEGARRVREALPSAALFADPVLGLGELAALVERSALVLTNDTGPRQMAVALGVPTVVAMGPTDPRYTAHHLERQRVLREPVACAPCGERVCPIDHRCLTRLAPERAVRAAQELLATA